MADKDCTQCTHEKQGICQKTMFRCAYERRYTDSDFCGPTARWFEPIYSTKADSDGGGA